MLPFNDNTSSPLVLACPGLLVWEDKPSDSPIPTDEAYDHRRGCPEMTVTTRNGALGRNHVFCGAFCGQRESSLTQGLLKK